MSAALKVISLNIEHSKHLARVETFLRREKPDVACVQEIFERDVPRISAACGGAEYRFAQMTRHIKETPPAIMGIAVFSLLPITKTSIRYYRGDAEHIPDFDSNDPATFQRKSHPCLFCDVTYAGNRFRIGTTHFTWTPDGKPDATQRTDIVHLLAALEEMGEFVLAGDFNAPRGGEIFDVLATKFKDNVPPHYTTSIDPSLHRAGKTRPQELADKMVDGIFSTPHYVVSDVTLVPGVSDHLALVAMVSTADT